MPSTLLALNRPGLLQESPTHEATSLTPALCLTMVSRQQALWTGWTRSCDTFCDTSGAAWGEKGLHICSQALGGCLRQPCSLKVGQSLFLGVCPEEGSRKRKASQGRPPLG